MSLCPTRLQCVAYDVRCMTYSLSLYGWDDDIKVNLNENKQSVKIPALLAASGTVFGDIVVWGAVQDQGNSRKDSDKIFHLS